MSVQSQISRLTEARNKIRNKLIDFGLAASTDGYDELATEIDGIANRGQVTAQVQEGETYTIPAGYHNGTGTVQGVSGGGNYTLQTKTVTPTKAQQSITPDNGYYGLSGVTVAAIPEAYQDVSAVDAVAANVLANKKFVASDGTVVAGTMVDNGPVSATIDGLTNTSYTIPAGYTSGGSISLTSDIEDALAAL